MVVRLHRHDTVPEIIIVNSWFVVVAVLAVAFRSIVKFIFFFMEHLHQKVNNFIYCSKSGSQPERRMQNLAALGRHITKSKVDRWATPTDLAK